MVSDLIEALFGGAGMASRKVQGNKKGRQPTKKYVDPQVSPTQSSSDEVAWPIWYQL